ncbi:hypothetical protein MBLNU13_g09026t1 [Cladosporium sp. NU13]
MSDNAEPGVDNLNRDSVENYHTMPTPQTLQGLSAELIGILSDRPSANDSSPREPSQAPATAYGSQSPSGHLQIFQTPSRTVQNLAVSASHTKRFEEHSEPDALDVTCLLQSMPNSTTIELVGNQTNSRSIHPANAGPVLFACMADPCLHATTHLSRLDSFAARLDAYFLSDCLQTHKHSLRSVSIRVVTLASLLAWNRVLETLHSSEVEGLELFRLQYQSITDMERIRNVPFPRQIVEELVRNSSRVDAAEVDIGSVATSMRGVEVIYGWVKPVLEILIRYLKGGI